MSKKKGGYTLQLSMLDDKSLLEEYIKLSISIKDQSALRNSGIGIFQKDQLYLELEPQRNFLRKLMREICSRDLDHLLI